MSTARTAPLRITAPVRKTIGLTAVQLDPASCHGVLIRAICPGQTVYLGVDGGVLTTTGWLMADGDVLDLAVKNANDLWFIASAAAQAVAVMPYTIR